MPEELFRKKMENLIEESAPKVTNQSKTIEELIEEFKNSDKNEETYNQYKEQIRDLVEKHPDQKNRILISSYLFLRPMIADSVIKTSHQIAKLLIESGASDVNEVYGEQPLLIHELNKFGTIEIAKTIANSSEFKLENLEHQLDALSACITKNKENLAGILINQKKFSPYLDVNEKCSLFEFSLIINKPNFVKICVDSSFDFDQEILKKNSADGSLIKQETMTPRELLVIYKKNFAEDEFINLINKGDKFGDLENDREETLEKINQFTKYAKSKFILNLSYAINDYGTYPKLVAKASKDLLEDQSFEKKEEVINILDVLQSRSGTIEKPDSETSYKINLIGFSDHANYFITEYIEKKPTKIIYCEPRGFENGYLAAEFSISEKNISKIKVDNFIMYNPFLEKKFTNPSLVIGVMKEKFGEELTYSIPGKLQKRGNCAFKAQNVVIRKMLNLLDQKMVFEVGEEQGEEGYKSSFITQNLQSLITIYTKTQKQDGEGYRVYKQYKNALQDNLRDDIKKYNEEQINPVKENVDRFIEKLKQKEESKKILSLFVELCMAYETYESDKLKTNNANNLDQPNKIYLNLKNFTQDNVKEINNRMEKNKFDQNDIDKLNSFIEEQRECDRKLKQKTDETKVNEVTNETARTSSCLSTENDEAKVPSSGFKTNHEVLPLKSETTIQQNPPSQGLS